MKYVTPEMEIKQVDSYVSVVNVSPETENDKEMPVPGEEEW